jgi:hypothetical protein
VSVLDETSAMPALIYRLIGRGKPTWQGIRANSVPGIFKVTNDLKVVGALEKN